MSEIALLNFGHSLTREQIEATEGLSVEEPSKYASVGVTLTLSSRFSLKSRG